jgi:hypothetical protein
VTSAFSGMPTSSGSVVLFNTCRRGETCWKGRGAADVADGGRDAEARGVPARLAEQRTLLVKRDTARNEHYTSEALINSPVFCVIIFRWTIYNCLLLTDILVIK